MTEGRKNMDKEYGAYEIKDDELDGVVGECGCPERDQERKDETAVSLHFSFPFWMTAGTEFGSAATMPLASRRSSHPATATSPS